MVTISTKSKKFITSNNKQPATEKTTKLNKKKLRKEDILQSIWILKNTLYLELLG